MSFNIITPGGIRNVLGGSSGINVPLGTAALGVASLLGAGALSFASQYFSSFAVDVVGVYDENFSQLITTARPMRASIQPNAKVMEHPVESGGVVTDWRVILPIEITLTMFLAGEDYQSVYKTIESMFAGTTLVTIQTKSGVYPNMLLAGMPHEETPDEYDMLAVGLRFREALLVSAQFQAIGPAQAPATDESTISRGEQPTGSVLFGLGNSLGLFSASK